MNTKQTNSNAPILIGGVWLRTDGDKLKVLVEIDGVWRVAIKDYWPDKGGSLISHICEPLGMIESPIDRVTNPEGKDGTQ